MKKILYIFFFFPFLMCCTVKRNAVNANETFTEIDTIGFYVEKEIKLGNPANFQFINKSQKPINVFGPWLKNIEKFEDGRWRKVRILYCPCGANCSAPPKTLILQASEKYLLEWNLYEGWCDKKLENGIPLTVEKLSLVGLYRISINYGVDQENLQTIMKEFKIIN